MFEWDAAKAARTLEKHGVTFFEASSVFTDPEALDLLDETHSTAERRSWRVGMSDEGRVVYTVRRSEDGETIRIISARKATKHEKTRYEND